MTQFIIQDNELSPPSSRSPERIRNPPHLHMKPSAKPNYRNARKHSWKWLQAVNRTQKLYFLNCQQTENQPNRFFFCKTFKLWSNVKSGLLRIFWKFGKEGKGESPSYSNFLSGLKTKDFYQSTLTKIIITKKHLF